VLQAKTEIRNILIITYVLLIARFMCFKCSYYACRESPHSRYRILIIHFRAVH